MKTVLSLILLFSVVSGKLAHAAPPAQKQLGEIELGVLQIEVADSDSNFTVIDARYDETATAAVLFGLVGAAANSAANASADDNKADTLRAGAMEIELSKLIAEELARTLGMRPEFSLTTDAGAAANVLSVEVHNWGLIRVSRDDQRMRAFLNLSFKILDPKRRVLFEKKRENSVGQDMAPFPEWTDSRLKTESERLAKKAGQYIANQIIYR